MASPRRGRRLPPTESLLLGQPRQAGHHPGGQPQRRAADPRERLPAGRPGASRPGRSGVRAAAALAGLVLAAAGGVAVFRAVSGSGGTLTGGATMVPATVRTVPPRTTADTAAALKPSVPVRIVIPSLRVDAPLIRLGRAGDGSVQVPPLANHNLAGWFDQSVTPGQDGTSVILGHVDSVSGTSVFYTIKNLTRGELVEVVRADGRTATFSVDGVQEVAKATFPSAQIYGDTRYPELRLITCGGPFDTATRQYLDNIVVYSHLIG